MIGLYTDHELSAWISRFESTYSFMSAGHFIALFSRFWAYDGVIHFDDDATRTPSYMLEEDMQEEIFDKCHAEVEGLLYHHGLRSELQELIEMLMIPYVNPEWFATLIPLRGGDYFIIQWDIELSDGPLDSDAIIPHIKGLFVNHIDPMVVLDNSWLRGELNG